jgi:hypothetical protein
VETAEVLIASQYELDVEQDARLTIARNTHTRVGRVEPANTDYTHFVFVYHGRGIQTVGEEVPYELASAVDIVDAVTPTGRNRGQVGALEFDAKVKSADVFKGSQSDRNFHSPTGVSRDFADCDKGTGGLDDVTASVRTGGSTLIRVGKDHVVGSTRTSSGVPVKG